MLSSNHGILAPQMSESGFAGATRPVGWHSGNVWARPESFGANPVRQLAVPSSVFPAVSGISGALEIVNNYGSWPAATADRPLAADQLWARLQLGAKPGDPLASAVWNIPNPLLRSSSGTVLDSYHDTLAFSEESNDSPGLRSPQLGAVHAVLGYWTTKSLGSGDGSHADGNRQDRNHACLACSRPAAQAAGPCSFGCAA